MSSNEPLAGCALGSWVMAAIIGVLAFVVARFFGEMSWTGSIFLGGVAFVVAGLLFNYLFCRELPALGEAVTQEDPPEPAPFVKEVAEAPALGTPALAPKPAPKPAPAPEPAADEEAESKPEMLTEAREGGPDNLKLIKGVGPKLEALLNSMGVYHFDQIGAWTAKEVAWVDENLEGFKGRVSRDEWVKQASLLAEGGATEFSKRVKKGDVY